MNEERDRDDRLMAMWRVMQMGNITPSVPLLKKYCESFQKIMKSREAVGEITESGTEYLEAIINSIVVETVAMYLSGGLDRYIEMEGLNGN